MSNGNFDVVAWCKHDDTKIGTYDHPDYLSIIVVTDLHLGALQFIFGKNQTCFGQIRTQLNLLCRCMNSQTSHNHSPNKGQS